MDLTLLNFDGPTEVRSFDRGRFELYVGRARARSSTSGWC
jgi:hypothetical protein